MTGPPTHLQYQPPAAEAEPVVAGTGRNLQIETGPMPGWVLVAVMLPGVVWLGFSVAMLGLLATSGASIFCSGVVLLASVVPTTVSVFRTWKHRGVPRRIPVSPKMLTFSDARTRGKTRIVGRRAYRPVVVERGRWRPWVYFITAHPALTQWSAYRAEPVVLMIDSNFRTMYDLCVVINTARLAPADDPHVRGAFEVVFPPGPVGRDQP